MKKWFSSDWHLGHEASIRLADRPFSSVEEMNATIINNMLETMNRGDHLWFLGDLATSQTVALDAIHTLKKHNIFFHWIIGNHDEKLINEEMKRAAASCRHSETIYLANKQEKVFLFHYPTVVWDQSFRNSWHLFGHIHKGSIDLPIVLPATQGKMLNVNVEFHDFKPWSEDELRSYMAERADNGDYTLLQRSRNNEL